MRNNMARVKFLFVLSVRRADAAMFQKMMFSVTLRMKTKTGCIRNERCSLILHLIIYTPFLILFYNIISGTL